MLKIDKKVPLPPPSRGRRATKYPWKEMQSGDSFLVPGAENVHTIRSQASNASKKLHARFSVREVEGGVRVWRVK